MQPFLKWAGGKRKLLPQLVPLLPPDYAVLRHVEPFAGGAALFFDQEPVWGLLNDSSPDLIATYHALTAGLEGVLRNLALLAKDQSEEAFYATRERYNRLTDRWTVFAAHFLYLNKTCFNGLHRVNAAGEFNVPFGRYHQIAFDFDAIARAASLLQSAEITNLDFTKVPYRQRDFVYFDPPYVPSSATASFTAYDKEGFGVRDQERLRNLFGELDRDCKLMLSNSDTPLVRKLYADYRIIEVKAARSINSRGSGRGEVGEVVVLNY